MGYQKMKYRGGGDLNDQKKTLIRELKEWDRVEEERNLTAKEFEVKGAKGSTVGDIKQFEQTSLQFKTRYNELGNYDILHVHLLTRSVARITLHTQVQGLSNGVVMKK